MPPVAVVFLVRDTHLAFRFQPKRTEIGQKMAKDLKLIACRKTIELQDARGIERGDVAMPDVARDAREIDCSESAFETAAHRRLGNRMALPQVFAQEERVDAGSVASHDHILIIVGENLRLNEIARAQQLGHGPSLANRAQSPA